MDVICVRSTIDRRDKDAQHALMDAYSVLSTLDALMDPPSAHSAPGLTSTSDAKSTVHRHNTVKTPSRKTSDLPAYNVLTYLPVETLI